MDRTGMKLTNHPLLRRCLSIGTLASMSLLFISCGPAHPERVALASANGTVLYDGKPAAGIELRLHADPPRPDGLMPLARTRVDGTFALTTYEDEDGAPPGEYVVAIVWPESSSGGPRADRLKNRYGDPKKSKWRVRIVEGKNVLETIQIPSGALEGEPTASKSRGRTKTAKSPDGPRSRASKADTPAP